MPPLRPNHPRPPPESIWDSQCPPNFDTAESPPSLVVVGAVEGDVSALLCMVLYWHAAVSDFPISWSHCF